MPGGRVVRDGGGHAKRLRRWGTILMSELRVVTGEVNDKWLEVKREEWGTGV